MTEFYPHGNYSSIRPGGNFYLSENGKWHHVLQDGVQAYGDYLHLYEVEQFDSREFREKEIRQIHVKDIPLKNNNGKCEHIHTYNCDDEYEVVDLQYKKIYPNKPLLHWIQELRRHL